MPFSLLLYSDSIHCRPTCDIPKDIILYEMLMIA
jgi:hypothetical protein